MSRPSSYPALLGSFLAACVTVAPPAPPPPCGAGGTGAPPPAVTTSPTTAALALPAPPPAAEGEFANVTIRVQKVAGSVYMLQGAGGNIGVSVGDDGIVLVDDEFAPLAPKIKQALAGITERPIKVVLNTHWHGDHTGSNAVFGREAPIIAHENVRKRLAAGRPATTSGEHATEAIAPAPHTALPIVTFDDKVFIHMNGEDIRAMHIPAGHTDGDVVISFTQSNVVHMGDDFVTYGFPFIDVASGGSVRGFIAAIDRVVKELPADVKVIPGHGDVSTADDMRKLSATLKDCVRIVEGEAKKKQTLAQIREAKVLAKYDDLGKGHIKADDFIETIFKEMAMPRGAAP